MLSKLSIVLVSAVVLTLSACGGDAGSGNVDVVLVDRSQSFCVHIENCEQRVSALIDDKLKGLTDRGGALRLFFIGSNQETAIQAAASPNCIGVQRGAAACFEKPTLWNSIFGRSGTQKKVARSAIRNDIEKLVQSTDEREGTSIFESIMKAEAYMADRRLPPGERQLLILSDMIEESSLGLPPLTCRNVGRPEQNREVIDLLRDGGQLPDLQFAVVEVVGESAVNRANGACREQFWRAYFDAAGADLAVYEDF
jgi:hypothetical protein